MPQAEPARVGRARERGWGGLALAAALSLLAVAPAAAAGEAAALTIGEGSVASRQVVGVGRDVIVEGEAVSGVAAVSGSVRVSGRVGGDVIVVGGDARLDGSAVIEGDLFVLGGRIEAAEGARINGRSVAYPTVSSAWLVLLEGPSLGQRPFAGVVLAAKLALIAAWLAWSLLLFATHGREVLSTADAIRKQPFRCFGLGLTGVLAAFLTAVFFSALAAMVVGLPLLALATLIALLLKLWGMVAVFHALGDWLGRRVARRRLAPLNAAIAGLLVLGVLKLVPWLGAWVWTVATFIGVGGTLITKFGRREPWFDPVLSRAPARRPLV